MSLNSLMEKVERVQYQAALAVTGTWQGTSRSKLYDELGWESLSDRCVIRRILQIYKIFENKLWLWSWPTQDTAWYVHYVFHEKWVPINQKT